MVLGISNPTKFDSAGFSLRGLFGLNLFSGLGATANGFFFRDLATIFLASSLFLLLSSGSLMVLVCLTTFWCSSCQRFHRSILLWNSLSQYCSQLFSKTVKISRPRVSLFSVTTLSNFFTASLSRYTPLSSISATGRMTDVSSLMRVSIPNSLASSSCCSRMSSR